MEGVVRLEVPTPEEGFVNITRQGEAALWGHTGLAYLFIPGTAPRTGTWRGTPTPTSRASSPGSTSSSWRRRGG